MATAKKPVVKKPVAKKVVAPAAPIKRGRRPKAVPLEPEEENELQSSYVAGEGTTQAEKKPEPTTKEILDMVEVIDLRQSNVTDRFAVVSVLAQEGYVFSTDIEGDPMNSWMTYLTTEALRIGNNKILYGVTEAEVKDSYDVSTPVVDHINQQVGFTFPGPDHPDFLEFGSAKYIRVG